MVCLTIVLPSPPVLSLPQILWPNLLHLLIQITGCDLENPTPEGLSLLRYFLRIAFTLLFFLSQMGCIVYCHLKVFN